MSLRHTAVTLATAAVLLVGLTACTTSRAQRRPYLIQENLDNAQRHLAANNTEEAAQIYLVVLLADPGNTVATSGLAAIPEHDVAALRPHVLGINLTRRPRSKAAALWARVLLYPVNRVLDLCDVVSVHVGTEGGVFVEAHVTHAVQVAAGAADGVQVGWGQPRDLAIRSAHTAGLALGPFNCESEGYTRAGTKGAAACHYTVVGLSRPTGLVYQRHRDYWGIGGRSTAAVVGAEVEVHPVEIADALCGFLCVDFLRDDLGSTRGLKLSGADDEAIEDLLNTLSASEISAHLRDRATPDPRPAQPPASAPGTTPEPVATP